MRVILLLLISYCLLLHGTEATKIVSLNQNWFLENEDGDYKISDITLPSGIYSELEAANYTESILYSYNDIKLRTFGRDMNWIYSLNFNVSQEDLDHEFVTLTFHGLDTITKIFLNEAVLGETNNMFRRYRFDVKSFLNPGTNKLIINFESAVNVAERLNEEMDHKIPPACPPKNYNGECHMNLLRKMQASFGWDWGLAAPSMGIWKNVELELEDSVHVRDITYDLTLHTSRNNILSSDSNESEDEEHSIEYDDSEDYWNLDFKIYVESGKGKSTHDGILTYELVGVSGSQQKPLTIYTNKYGKSIIDINMIVEKSKVKMWWPNGYGDQQLYNFKVKWEDVRVNGVNYSTRIFLSAEKKICIGFRTIELVQNSLGNGLSFFFRVNNISIYMKGSNWIPAHILPEKSADEGKVKELLQAARDAHMNMLRVWGGGVYESDYFYNLADSYGILIWQDMMFACAMYPAGDFLESVRYEVRDQIQRIQYHPSIALFATNNENEVALRQNWYGTSSSYDKFAKDYQALYEETVADEIRKYDKNRKILLSSPSNGDWNRDRDEFHISMDPQSKHFGDIHYYTQSTNSWMPWTFSEPRFASEFGFQSYPAGWRQVARPNVDEITDLISHRQHHPLNSTLIIYLVQENLNVEFEKLDWTEQVYLSQVSQAIALKTETEVYRKGRGEFMNTMGALYWQLNDVWVAPSWSSIEYNGNFKIVHYSMQNLFAPVSIIAHLKLPEKVQIYALSDEINVGKKPMTIKLKVHKFNQIEIVHTIEWKFQMKPNEVTLVNTTDLNKLMAQTGLDVYEFFMMFHLYDDSDCNSPISSNFIFPGNYSHLKGIRDPKLTFEFSSNKCESDQQRISLIIRVETPAMFVYITLDHDDIKKYKLSQNGFIQTEPMTAVQLTFENPGCEIAITSDSVKIQTLNKYMIN